MKTEFKCGCIAEGSNSRRYSLMLLAGAGSSLLLMGRECCEDTDRVCSRTGYPKATRVDNGTEFSSPDLDFWAYEIGLLTSRQTNGHRRHRSVQLQAQVRMLKRPLVQEPCGCR